MTMALIIMLICVVLSGIILSSAEMDVKHDRSLYCQRQAYMTVDSAEKLLREQLEVLSCSSEKIETCVYTWIELDGWELQSIESSESGIVYEDDVLGELFSEEPPKILKIAVNSSITGEGGFESLTLPETVKVEVSRTGDSIENYHFSFRLSLESESEYNHIILMDAKVEMTNDVSVSESQTANCLKVDTVRNSRYTLLTERSRVC